MVQVVLCLDLVPLAALYSSLVTMNFMDASMQVEGGANQWDEMPGHSESAQKRSRAEAAPTPKVFDATRELDILKQVSNLSQKIRFLASIMCWTIMLPASILEPSITAARTFGQENKGIKHNKGSPHPMIWRITLMNLLGKAHAQAEKLEGDAKKHLIEAITTVDQYYKKFIAHGPKKSYMFIKQCQVRTTRDEAKSILKFETSPMVEDSRTLQMAIIFVIEALGGQVLEGTEASTDLERRLQSHIDVLKGGKK